MIKVQRTAAGAIDREWLLSLLPTAKRQDLLLMLVTTILSIDRIAAAAWVAPRVLIQYVLGMDTLTAHEIAGLRGGLCNADSIPLSDAFLDRDGTYTPLEIEDGDELERTSEGVKLYPPDHPARAVCEKLLTWDIVPFELYCSALDVVEAHKQGDVKVQEMASSKPRTRRNKT